MNTIIALTWALDGLAVAVSTLTWVKISRVRRELAAMNTVTDTPTDWDIFDEGNRP